MPHCQSAKSTKNFPLKTKQESIFKGTGKVPAQISRGFTRRKHEMHQSAMNVTSILFAKPFLSPKKGNVRLFLI